jgi:3-oxoacyl-[acyl-carrier-protein] synthase III
MDGQAVFKFAVKALADVAYEVTEKANVSLDSIDCLIPHQANIRILQSTAKKLNLSDDKLVVTVDQHANTSAASIPLALNHAVTSGRLTLGTGQRVLLEGIGGGMAWGAVLLDI